MKKKMIVKKSWEEFKTSGLLWFANTILHVFGWAIVLVYEKGKVIDAYPARVRFRGFSSNDGYIAVTKYMLNNVKYLMKEVKE